ncbi:hypothetical protein CSUI_002941 [Cystoisospora suis]|uniref:Uncharacterized protein n=1 Tax=Cystoisospora suis TaxID=483139 RepID=A0A2C6KGP0_9APIC|nr:hypothetical protein CSUI_002941 [Cystoisospora suis]
MKAFSGMKRERLFSSFSFLVLCLITWGLTSLFLFSSTVFCEEPHQAPFSDSPEDSHQPPDGQPHSISHDHNTRYRLLVSLFLSAYLTLLQHAGRAATKEKTRILRGLLSASDDKDDGQTSPFLPSPSPEDLQEVTDTEPSVNQDILPPPPPSPSLSSRESSREEDEESSSERVVHTSELQSTSRKGHPGALLGKLINASVNHQRSPSPRHYPESPAHGRSLYSRHTRSKTAVSRDLRAKSVETPVGIERTTSLSTSFSHFEYFHTPSPPSPSSRRRESSASLSHVVVENVARRRLRRSSSRHMLHVAKSHPSSSSAVDHSPATSTGQSSSSPPHSPRSGRADDPLFVQESQPKVRRRVTSHSRSQRFYLLRKTFTYVQQAIAIVCIIYGLFQLFQMWQAGVETHLRLDVETRSSSLSSDETDGKRNSDKETDDKLNIEKRETNKMVSSGLRTKVSPKIREDLGEPPKRTLRRKESQGLLQTGEIFSPFVGDKQTPLAKQKRREKKKAKEEEDRIPSFTMLS